MAVGKFLTGAASGAMATASSGNPYLIGGGAIVGGVANLLTQDPDPRAEELRKRTAMDRVRRMMFAQADRNAAESGSQLGTGFASRGISGPMKAGIIMGSQRKARQSAMDRVSQMHYQMEMGIAEDYAAADEAKRQARNAEIMGLITQGGALANKLANPTAFDSPGIMKLRDWIGMENVEQFDINKINLGNGVSVGKDTAAGKIHTESPDFFNQLSQAYAGSMEDLLEILKSLSVAGAGAAAATP